MEAEDKEQNPHAIVNQENESDIQLYNGNTILHTLNY